MEFRRLFLPVLAAALLAAGCESEQGTGVKTTVAGLTNFESCEELAGFLESKSGSNPVPVTGGTGGGEENADFGAPAAAPSDLSVEEADIVKRDGDRLYVVTNFGRLFAYDVSNPSSPHRIGDITLAVYPIEMHLSGTRVAVIGQPVSYDSPYPYEPATRVVVYDFANAAAPVILREFDFKGTYSDSRKVGDALYLALQRWISNGGAGPFKDQLEDRSPCDRVYVPEDMDGNFYSFSEWDVIGIDLNAPAAEPNRVSVIGSWGSTITSTPEHFYLTNHFYETDETGIYLFDLDPSTAGISPRAAARVPGSIVNQFSMDETDGIFRIVSTDRPAWIWVAAASELPPPPPSPTNYLTTFRASDGSLKELAQIDTIVPGESITAARFLGDRAFVTTFVVTDPLVAIDLSDPTAPRVSGELHLPGRTDYLQAWGDDRLIAIGSATGWSGVVLNLFDIADLDHPALVEQETIPDSYYSEAQYEHLAFSFFEGQRVLAVPVGTASGSELAVYAVNRDTGFTELGAVNHDDLGDFGGYSPPMRRSLEIDSLLYSVSEAGLKVNAFTALTSDLFAEMFPGFTAPYYGCDCFGDVCGCPQPL